MQMLSAITIENGQNIQKSSFFCFFLQGDETNFTVLSKTQIIPFLKKRKKDLERTKTTIQNRLAGKAVNY